MHSRSPARRPLRLRGAGLVLGTALLATLLPAATVRGEDLHVPALAMTARPAVPPAPDLRPFVTAPGQGPGEMYLDAQEHAGDANTFAPGGRVTVGFQPRAGDDGPAGFPGIPARATGLAIPAITAPAAPSATGLRRDVYGFLPYWELSDPSTRLNFSVLSHVAYFSLGVDGSGNLLKRNTDGTLTTGWAGWTSARMTDVITEAHVAGTRVTLTLSVFAYTSGQSAIQAALLGSPAARTNLASQAVAAVRDRGADGINLDFEPIVKGYEDQFVALVQAIRAGFEAVGPGYHLSFDTLGQPANYPLEQALGAAGADSVFVMGYDYRTASSSYAGSVDPLNGPAYDLTETVQAYLARIPADRIILGVPYFGRAWSTVSDAQNAKTQTGATYGYSAAVNYDNAVALAAQYGRRYDDREISAWVAYQKQTCSSGSCATTWRQLYYDDEETLRARYDMVIRSGIQGVGIWALGYDGSRPELYQALADKFLTDTTPPQAGINLLPAIQGDEGFSVSWTGVDDWNGVASYDLQVSTDGGPWADWITGTQATSDVWLGADGHAYAFRVRARDGKGNLSAWNVTSVFVAAPTLGPGGFGRVTAPQLNIRSAPTTSATRLASATAGDVFAITDGPTNADGYTWYQVSGPITAWRPAGYVRADAWVAASGSGTTNLVPIPAPNSATVQATISGVTFGSPSSPPASSGPGPAAVAARSFSPNGDGSKDRLAIAWTNRQALDTLTLAVFGPDGSLAGSVPLPANLAAGPQSATWDGLLGGSPAPDGSYVLQLAGTAAGIHAAWPSANPVTPGQRAAVGITVDTQPPTLGHPAISATRLSPNGDGRYDSVAVTGLGSAEAVGWALVVAPASGGPAVRTIVGGGTVVKATWDGRADDGSAVADGSYGLTLSVFDAAGNPAEQTWTVVVDSAPSVVGLAATPPTFSPDGDGTADSSGLAWTSSEAGSGSLRILRGTALIQRWTLHGTSGAVTWTGHDSAGRPAPDGRYTLTLDWMDATGNRTTQVTTLLVDRTAGFLRAAPTLFFPQDGDALAAVSTISFRLARTAKVTLAILDATGTAVRGAMTGVTRGPGTWTWRWDGRVAGGAMAPRGTYVAALTVVGPYGTTVLRRSLVADAFSSTLSAAALGPGQQVTVRFRSAEPLAALPTASLRQAGLAPAAMKVHKLSDGSFSATATIAPDAPGPATIVLTGSDTGRHANSSVLTLTVQ
jgi:spore germination protein YaaH